MKIIDKANSTTPFSALGVGSVCKISYDEGNCPVYAMKIDAIEDSGYNTYNAIDLENGELLDIATSKKVVPIEVELVVV